MRYKVRIGDIILMRDKYDCIEIWLIKSIRKNLSPIPGGYNIRAKVLKRNIDYGYKHINDGKTNGYTNIGSLDIRDWNRNNINSLRFKILDRKDAMLEVL